MIEADDEELHPEVKPLTVAEFKWLLRVERALAACPSKRLHLSTMGDSSLQVIDGDVTRRHNLDIHDGHASENGVLLATIDGGVPVHATTG